MNLLDRIKSGIPNIGTTSAAVIGTLTGNGTGIIGATTDVAYFYADTSLTKCTLPVPVKGKELLIISTNTVSGVVCADGANTYVNGVKVSSTGVTVATGYCLYLKAISTTEWIAFKILAPIA